MPDVDGVAIGRTGYSHYQYSKKSAADMLRNEDGDLRLSKPFLKQLCKEMNQYTTPELNDQLYLHFKGFQKIEALDEYVGLKCLWLEGNGLSKIENVEHLVKLRGLYVQQNCISVIEGIETLVFLDTLNISNNVVGTISGLGGCSMLTTLTMTHNRCKTADDIEDPEAMEVFKAMPGLRVLNLMGNPVIRKTTQYRKTMINEIKQLSYLDDRPVFPKERVCAEAFMKGGREAEREARTKFMEDERERQARGIRHLMELQAQGREQARLGLDGADADRTDSEAENDTTDDENETTVDDESSGYESWQMGSGANMHQNMPNIMDQMSGNIPTDNTNWQPDPALENVEVEEPKVMELEELEALDTITGPKAADIDLFDSEDEFEELEEDFMNHADGSSRAGAVAEPFMTVSSSTRTATSANNNAPVAASGRTKMLIEEVKAPVAAAAAGGGKAKTKLIIEEEASKSESDEDEIPEEISVDIASGVVTNLITEVAPVTLSPPPASPLFASSSSSSSRPLIEVIGGDDVDGLD
eukprot:gene4388-7259_t